MRAFYRHGNDVTSLNLGIYLRVLTLVLARASPLLNLFNAVNFRLSFQRSGGSGFLSSWFLVNWLGELTNSHKSSQFSIFILPISKITNYICVNVTVLVKGVLRLTWKKLFLILGILLVCLGFLLAAITYQYATRSPPIPDWLPWACIFSFALSPAFFFNGLRHTPKSIEQWEAHSLCKNRFRVSDFG